MGLNSKMAPSSGEATKQQIAVLQLKQLNSQVIFQNATPW